MTSNVPNIRLSFPLETSNSFQVLSPDFPPLQSSKSFIQASKSKFESKVCHLAKKCFETNFLTSFCKISFTTLQPIFLKKIFIYQITLKF